MNEFTVTYAPELTEAEEAAASQAAVERHRTFLETCINAYMAAYTDYFAPNGYHQLIREMGQTLRQLPAAQQDK